MQGWSSEHKIFHLNRRRRIESRARVYPFSIWTESARLNLLVMLYCYLLHSCRAWDEGRVKNRKLHIKGDETVRVEHLKHRIVTRIEEGAVIFFYTHGAASCQSRSWCVIFPCCKGISLQVSFALNTFSERTSYHSLVRKSYFEPERRYSRRLCGKFALWDGTTASDIAWKLTQSLGSYTLPDLHHVCEKASLRVAYIYQRKLRKIFCTSDLDLNHCAKLQTFYDCFTNICSESAPCHSLM